MTDISDWESTVHLAKFPHRNTWTGKEEDFCVERIMVPLNEYQMGNLIDAISQVSDTGDWWHEFCAIVGRAMQVAKIKELRCNRGRTFTFEQIFNGDIREKPVAK